MSILPNFIRSLVLTSLFSFIAPILFMGGTLAGLSLISYIPGFDTIGQYGAQPMWQFLTIFGSGCPLRGMLVIGMTCGLVGAIFDTYAFYKYQTLRGN